MEAWFEEDEQSTPITGPHRVDILASTRKVTVLLDGLVWPTRRAPTAVRDWASTRYYIPHVCGWILEGSATVAPPIGRAETWSVQVGELAQGSRGLRLPCRRR